jgi:MarR family transcriptional regulator, organic hydroperoxide resistance regulator
LCLANPLGFPIVAWRQRSCKPANEVSLESCSMAKDVSAVTKENHRCLADSEGERGLTIIDNFLCFALYSASRTMNQLYRHYLKKIDVTYPQLLVLLLLLERDHRNIHAIGEMLFLDTGTLTPLLKRLESKGFVKRERSKEDERSVIISLTQAGKNVQDLLKDLAPSMLCDLEMEPDEVIAMANKIHSIRRTIAEKLKAYE